MTLQADTPLCYIIDITYSTFFMIIMLYSWLKYPFIPTDRSSVSVSISVQH
jgi:hypothetical protein